MTDLSFSNTDYAATEYTPTTADDFGSVRVMELSTKRLAKTIKNTPLRNMPVPDVVVDDSRDALLTPFSKATLKDRYLTEDESYQDRFANCVRYYANDGEHAQRMYDYISKLWCMPATPILSNGGTTKGNLISCFINDMDDSLEDIVGTWVENIWMGAKGGGIGTYVGGLREIGGKVGTKGKTSGAISFVKVIDSLTACISQAGNRRGAAAVYMDVSHPEIEAFIELRNESGGDPNRKALNLYHGVCIPDAFMEAVENDAEWDLISPKTGKVVETVRAQDIAIKILQTRMNTGTPYIFFSDTVKRATPEHHAKSGLYPHTSNLCVAPETRVLTRDGYMPINQIAGTVQEVWNGKQWSEAQVAKTGENQKLVSVYLSNGVKLDVTEYHKWKIQLGYGEGSTNSKMVATHELRKGDKLAKPNLPVVEAGFSWDSEFAYRNGFYTADGTNDQYGNPRLYLYAKKKELLSHFASMDPLRVVEDEAEGKRHAVYFDKADLLPKFTVPIDGNVATKLSWFAGFMDGDGTVARNGDCETLQAASIHKDFLMEVRLMLTTLGVDAKVNRMRLAGTYELPDGKGGNAFFDCKDVYRLVITAGDTQRLLNLGLSFRRLDVTQRETQRDAHQFVTVVDIQNNGRVDDTYCFNEPLEHLGVFEGVLTGNCIEITLPTGKDHKGIDRTAVCCLFQPNAEKFNEWKDNDQFFLDIAYFMDNVLQDFIDNAGECFTKARYSAMRERSIGVGMMGFHSFLQSKMIPYESVMAKVWNLKICNHLKTQMDAASRRLAEERGACPDAAEHGVMERFSYKTAAAPTASVSIICGGTSAGFDIIPANVFTQKTLDGSFEVKNPYLQKILVGYGKDTRAVWNSITEKQGSVQHLDFLSQDERDVFKTSFEVDQRYHVEFAADRAPLFDQAQSFNLSLQPNVDKRDLWKLHQMAWKLGVKTMYYLRSMSVGQVGSTSSAAGKDLSAPTASAKQINYSECLSCQ